MAPNTKIGMRSRMMAKQTRYVPDKMRRYVPLFNSVHAL